MPQNSKALVAKYQQIWDAAEAEDRDLTASERERVERIVDQAQAQHELEQKLKALGLGGEFAAPTDPNVSFTNGGGPGDAFIHGEFFGGGPFGAAHGGNSPGMFGASIWTFRWSCPTPWVPARRWSGTSASRPTSGDEEARA
jgi:hypothetical protein